MNEKIKQLMIEAGNTIPGDKHIDADFCEKFAELVVKECANVCRNEWLAGSSVQRYGNQCADSIEFHFKDLKEDVEGEVKEDLRRTFYVDAGNAGTQEVIELLNTMNKKDKCYLCITTKEGKPIRICYIQNDDGNWVSVMTNLAKEEIENMHPEVIDIIKGS